jgi:hypothetical protein
MGLQRNFVCRSLGRLNAVAREEGNFPLFVDFDAINFHAGAFSREDGALNVGFPKRRFSFRHSAGLSFRIRAFDKLAHLNTRVAQVMSIGRSEK